MGFFLLAIPLSPMLIPSSLIIREERQVLRRDETYPDFIRALGGTAQARSVLNLLRQSRLYEVLILVCWIPPLTDLRSGFPPVSTRTARGITSTQIPTQP